MKIKATQRTLAEMRKRGYLCGVVEKRIPGMPITQDLFGFIDVLCVRRDEIVGVQSTSATNISTRITKITDHENVAAVRESGMRILVHGWKRNAKGRYELREVDLS